MPSKRTEALQVAALTVCQRNILCVLVHATSDQTTSFWTVNTKNVYQTQSDISLQLTHQQLNYQPSRKSCGSLFLYDQLYSLTTLHLSLKGNINCMGTSRTALDTDADDGELPFDLQLAVHNW